uniref:Translation initiation factor eIF2B subunit delta n=1 Tax=Anopheles coluzzii TaxID=1518534 RepID=A0A6E8VND3_ANOCL|nr:translation initiation factor eIF-2B subunit delta isoform X2 [Anopheles coluzzii]
METVASTEAGTLKKKRNRSHKKPKPEAATVNCESANIAQQQTKLEKENNPPARAATGATNQRPAPPEAPDAPELTRKPSRRRKRKPKSDKKEEQIESLEAITVEELFPPGKIFSAATSQRLPAKLVAVVETVATANKPSIEGTKYAGVIDIDPHELFPSEKELPAAIQNITAQDIFPGPELFQFNLGGIPGKLSFGKSETPVSTTPKGPLPRKTTATDLQGLHDISSFEIFPNCMTVGLKVVSEKASKTTHHSQEQSSPATTSIMSAPAASGAKTDKTREEILAEREAKKAAKLAAKTKSKDKEAPPPAKQQQQNAQSAGKAKEQRPAGTKVEPAKAPPTELKKSSTDASICEKMKELHISDGPAGTAGTVAEKSETKELSKAERKALFEAKNPALAGNAPEGATKPAKPALSKAERRAIQEAQRAAKAEAQQTKKRDTPAAKPDAKKPGPKADTEPVKTKPLAKKAATPTGAVGGTGAPRKHIVNLFNHLHQPKFAATDIVNSPTLHPAVTKLGIQYAKGAVVGSKARCLALLKVLNQLIHDYETPPEKEFGRSFEEMLNVSANHLQRCRPFSVSMTNALRHVKMYTRQLDGKVSVSEQKECLLESIESYMRDQIEKAEEAICCSVQDKICDGDVILTYGCSSLIKHILEEAIRRKKTFRVIIVNARPRQEENAMLEELVQLGVKCMCVLINAVAYVMPEVTKVLLGAHALLANGSVMSRVGTAQIALVAKSYNVPVLVCCETHKFTERVQTDAFVYNEIGNPNELVVAPRTRDNAEAKPMLADWETITSLTILNLHYDVTPPELVTAVVTEVAILPCTSVPVILRIKPSDVAY